MKKIIIITSVLVVVAASAVFFMRNTGSDDAGKVVSSPPAHQIYESIRELTSAQLSNYGFGISLLVPGETIIENTWDFRGTARSTERDKPFFGSIKNTCVDFGNAACWRLVSLNLDGTALSLTTDRAAGNTAALDGKTSPEQSASSQQDHQQPRLQKSEEKPKPTPEPQIWHTRTNNVNGRTGPGANFSVAFKIPTSIKLKFIEKRAGWGLFRYSAEGGKEGKIWVSMRLVEPQ